MDTCTVLVVDSNRRLRQLILEILGSQPYLRLVGEATDGQEAVHMALATRPDVVLMDIRLPQVNGLDAARRIVSTLTGTKVILFSLFDLPEYRAAAVASGASHYLTKPTLHVELMPIIRGLMADQARVV